MFTGIIQTIASIEACEMTSSDARFRLRVTDGFLDQAKPGDSIAVNGACLTVVELTETSFMVDVSAETLSCTTLAERVEKDQVNLEKALAFGDRLDGHLVTGHVDTTSTLQQKWAEGASVRMRFALPGQISQLVAEKGSIAIDGVSLTVNHCDDECFEVNIIPHTLEHTTLGQLTIGKRVNLEIDLMARYAARILGKK